MPKFMNAELIAIRDSLKCGCCEKIFKGSDSQAWKVKYEKAAVYCSSECRFNNHRAKLSKPIPMVGLCKRCKVEIYSRNKKKVYCSITCYRGSNQFIGMTNANLETISNHDLVKTAIRQLNLAVGNIILDADQKLIGLRAKGSKTVVAKVYERTGRLIHCLNCQKPKYTPASTARKYCSHKCYHDHRTEQFKRWKNNPELGGLEKANEAVKCGLRKPRSAQATENALKGRAETKVPNPIRTCLGCQIDFKQSTPFGKAKYCTRTCRKNHYSEEKKKKSKTMVRQQDGTFKWIDRE